MSGVVVETRLDRHLFHRHYRLQYDPPFERLVQVVQDELALGHRHIGLRRNAPSRFAIP